MARLPANFSELLAIRQDRAPTLDAKIHGGYDATAEYKEQGNLLSSVQYGQGTVSGFSIAADLPISGNITLPTDIAQVGAAASNMNINNVSDFNFQSAPLVINNISDTGQILNGSNASVGVGSNAPQVGNFAAVASGVSDGNFGVTLGNNDVGAGIRIPPLSEVAVPPVASPSAPPVDDGTDTMPDPTSNPGNGGNHPPILTPPTAPVLNVPNIAGNEDTTIALPISLTIQTGPGITNVVTIVGVPLDATLSAGVRNNDGSYTLTPAQLAGLTIIPGHDFNGAFNLTVTATTTQDGVSVTNTAQPVVTVASIADAPPLAVTTTLNSDHTYNVDIATSLVHPSPTETLSVNISNLPPGTVLNHGTHNSDGSWTLTPAQLAGLVLTPPANYNGDLSFMVTSTAADNNTSAATTTIAHINVTDAADAPTLSVQTASGVEDTTIPLTIAISANDTNPAEILSVTISNLPVGAVLNHGVHNSDGSWTLTPAQLTGLTITTANNYNGAFDLNVTATASENGTLASISSPLHVNVIAAADIPNLTVAAATGSENTPIPLTINTSLSDNDAGETLSIIIGGIPNGATLNHGVHNSDGTWTLSPADLTGLTITTPNTWGGTLHLDVTAVTAENGTTASNHAQLDITVTMPGNNAVPPTLSVSGNVTGNEDTPIGVTINANVPVGEGLSIIVGNVPAGATLSAGINNGNGTWTLTPGQLSNLTFTPPHDVSGNFTLTVDAVGSVGGDTAHAMANINIHVAGIADTPNLTVQSAVGNEDTAIPLNIISSLNDTDGSETLSVVLTGLPMGAILNHGTHNSDGTWTLTVAQLSSLTVTPPANYNGAFDIHVTATASEDNTAANISADLHVTVNAVADAPLLSVTSASGNEDNQIALTINATEVDLHGALSVTLTGLPAGCLLSAGTHNSDGSWTLSAAQLANLKLTPPVNYSGDFNITVTATSVEGGSSVSVSSNLPVHVVAIADVPNLAVTGNVTVAEGHDVPLTISSTLVDTDGSEHLGVTISGVPSGACLSAGLNNGNGSWTLTPAQLNGLTMHLPNCWSGDINLVVTANAIEQSNGDHASATAAIHVHVTPEATPPSLICLPAIGLEDHGANLVISAALNDTDGSETLGVTVSGLPSGCTLNHGTHNSDGSWTLSVLDLVGLKLNTPLNYHGDFNVTVTAIANEGSLHANVAANLNVHIAAVADTPSCLCGPAQGAAGAQITLAISGSTPDAGETLSYIIHGIPAGFALNHGCNNGDNSWTLSAADLNNLKLITPGSFNGQLHLHVEAVSHEPSNSDSCTSGPGDLLVKIGNWATGQNIDLGIDAHVGGIGVGVGVDLFPASGGLLTASVNIKEDVPFLLADAPQLLNLSALHGLTGLIANITCSGVPAGCSFNHGTLLSNGNWQFSITDLTGLILSPPANYSGDFNINFTAVMLSGLLPIALTTNLPVHVMGIADVPLLSATAAAHVGEHSALVVTINGALTDTDGSENLSYLVSGLPAGFTLNHGTCNSNGTWSLSAADLSGLTITPSDLYHGTVNAMISAIATESNGSQNVTQQALSFIVDAAVHAPLLAAHNCSGNEDQPLALNLGVALAATDGSEHLSALTIAGVPIGGSLSHATDNHDGTWSVDLLHIADVQFTPGDHWSGDTNFTIAATSEIGSTHATATATIGVHVNAVANTPIIAVGDSTGYDNAPIDLHLSAHLADTDGSEHLSVVLSGVPEGMVLSAGIHNANGTWSLEPGWLDHLTITAPDHFTGDMQLHLAAWSTESSNGSVASIQQDFAVHVMHH